MKHIKFALFVLACIAVWSFTGAEESGLRGNVNPMEAVLSVYVIAGGKDSLKAVPVNGFFTLPAKPGIYQLFVDARPGYRDMLLERIVVEEGKMTDVGTLVLEKMLP